MEIILKDPGSVLTTLSTLSNEDLEFIITNDLRNILQHIRFKQYFRYNLDSYCNFIAHLLKRIKTVKTISMLLQNDLLFQKNFINEEKFREHFLGIIFPVLLDKLSEVKDHSLYEEICGIFKKIILEKRSAEFQHYLETMLKLAQKNNEKFDIPKAVLKIIGETYNYYPESYSTAKIVLQSLINCFKDFRLIYSCSVILMEVLGFDMSRDFSTKKVTKFCPSDIDLTRSLAILSELLFILKDSKIDLNSSVNINFFQFIENIVISVIGLTQTPNKVCYEILEYAIDIHPLLVEKSLNNLLAYSMCADNSFCQVHYTRFLMKVFETYAKLHRIQNLISKMMPILKSSYEIKCFEEYYTFKGKNGTQKLLLKHLNVDNLLPSEVLQYFSQCTLQMASWQYMNVFKTLIFHLETTSDSFISSKSEIHNTFIEILCKFTSELLKIDRIDENTSTPKIMENFIVSMGEMKNILYKLGGALLEREHNQLLVRVFLDLSNSWAGRMLYFYDTGYILEEEMFYETSHPNYLFSFLSNEQWILLSQRIMNFGESTCNHLMLILTLKKLSVMQIMGNKMDENVQQEAIHQITSNKESACEYIVFNKFICQHLVRKLDPDVIMQICDHLLCLVDVKPNIVRNIYSDVWSKALCLVLLKKISKTSKSKSGSLTKKLLSTVDNGIDDLNSDDDETYFKILKKVYQENLYENRTNDNTEKVRFYGSCLMQLNVLQFPAKYKALLLLVFFSLHKQCCSTESSFKNDLESWIIFLMQKAKLNLMMLFEPVSLVKYIIKDFGKKEEFLVILSKLLLKQEEDCRSFAPAIDYLLKDPNNVENLQFSLLFLKDLKRMKTSKLCLDVKEKILNVNFEMVITCEANVLYIQSYVHCLKHWMVFEEKHKLTKLTEKLEDYLNIIFDEQSDILPKGSTSLFCTVVPNKHIFKSSQDLPSRLWTFCKTKKVDPSELQDYSKLICLIFEHIQNSKFEIVCSDFLGMVVESVKEKNPETLFKLLHIGVSLLVTSLNPVKFEILQKVLEDVLLELCHLKESTTCDQEVFREIMQFEIAVINRKLLNLSPGMMSILLMSPYILLNKGTNFYETFNICIDHMECLLKHRSALIMDRISVYLKLFRCLLSSLCSKCGEVEKKSDLNQLEDLTHCALQLEKLIRHLVKFKRDMESIACYLIGDILFEYERHTLFPKVKVHLNNCIYSLLAICDQHAISYLLRVLSSSSRELFKEVYDKYKKFHTFKGKV